MNDVINGVPMEQIRAALTKVEDVLEAAYHNAYPECCGRAGQECCGDAVQAWSEADQKVMDVLSPIRRALSDILATAQPADHSEHDLNMVSQPTADGEREAFEAWAASVGYHTERDMFQREKYQSSLTWELGAPDNARAAQPQQAVAVTDEVQELKDLLRQSEAELEDWRLSFPDANSHDTDVLLDRIDAALSAHKTGEEE